MPVQQSVAYQGRPRAVGIESCSVASVNIPKDAGRIDATRRGDRGHTVAEPRLLTCHDLLRINLNIAQSGTFGTFGTVCFETQIPLLKPCLYVVVTRLLCVKASPRVQARNRKSVS